MTHVAVKLLVDYGDFRASQRAGVFPRRSKRGIIEQILPPNVGADERKVLPVDTQPGRELLLERPHRALARCRCPLDVHDQRAGLRGKEAVALAARSIQEKRRKIFSHCEAAVVIAYQSQRDRSYELAVVRQPAMNRKDRFGGRDQRLVAGSFESVLGRLGPLTPAVDTNNISAFGTRDFMRRHPVARW